MNPDNCLGCVGVSFSKTLGFLRPCQGWWGWRGIFESNAQNIEIYSVHPASPQLRKQNPLVHNVFYPDNPDNPENYRKTQERLVSGFIFIL